MNFNKFSLEELFVLSTSTDEDLLELGYTSEDMLVLRRYYEELKDKFREKFGIKSSKE